MPKHKNKDPETVNELLAELESVNDVVRDEITKNVDDAPPQKKGPPQSEGDAKRDQLVKLTEDGEINKSVAYIKKASKKIIDKLYSEFERKRMQKANEFLTDLLISKFTSTLGGLDAIEQPEKLSDELKKDELLKRDVYSIVESISPYIPFLGVISGGVTMARHIYKHKTASDEPKEAPTYN